MDAISSMGRFNRFMIASQCCWEVMHHLAAWRPDFAVEDDPVQVIVFHTQALGQLLARAPWYSVTEDDSTQVEENCTNGHELSWQTLSSPVVFFAGAGSGSAPEQQLPLPLSGEGLLLRVLLSFPFQTA